MSKFNLSQNIGDIVSIMPAASKVFKEYNIDFCCGGNRPLSEAIKEQGLDGAEVIEKLDKASDESENYSQNQVDFRNFTPGELVDYIVNTHHTYTKKVLPQLGELSAKILKVHGANHNALFKVHTLFNKLKDDLEQHLIKEEEIVFPIIKEYVKGSSSLSLDKVRESIMEIESEHDGAGDILKELRKITDQYTVPADGCRTYELTFHMLQELESDLFQHIHLENNILFKSINIS